MKNMGLKTLGMLLLVVSVVFISGCTQQAVYQPQPVEGEKTSAPETSTIEPLTTSDIVISNSGWQYIPPLNCDYVGTRYGSPYLYVLCPRKIINDAPCLFYCKVYIDGVESKYHDGVQVCNGAGNIYVMEKWLDDYAAWGSDLRKNYTVRLCCSYGLNGEYSKTYEICQTTKILALCD